MRARTLLFVLLAAAAVACYLILRTADRPADMRKRIEVHKSARELEFHDGRGGVRKFSAALGFAPKGNKAVEGDGATPEGEYFVCVKNPKSAFFLSLGISYPGPQDADRGLAAGLITEAEHAEILKANAEHHPPPWKTALGGEVFIHGRGAQSDWTAGCVAVEDPDMAELYDLAEVGMPVIIRP
ncbi:MAG: L,D-transpeptidase family protein [Chthoniobacterales bacterium]